MAQTSTGSKKESTAQSELSRQQPVWHVLVLHGFTMFAYLPFWFFKNWTQLSDKAKEILQSEEVGSFEPSAAFDQRQKQALKSLSNCNPWLRTAAMLSPLLVMLFLPAVLMPFFPAPVVARYLAPLPLAILLLEGIFAFGMFRDAARLYPRPLSLAHKEPNLAGFVLTMCMFGFLSLDSAPNLFHLLFLTGCIPVAIAQKWINAFWQEVEPKELIVRQAFSTAELLALIAGGILLGLVVTHYAVPS